jgi:hypothetical protein
MLLEGCILKSSILTLIGLGIFLSQAMQVLGEGTFMKASWTKAITIT